MTKQIYIRGNNYGGEMTIGEVTPEFVNYWQPICKKEGDSRLMDHLMALESWNGTPEEEDGFDKDSPAIYAEGEEWNAWHDCDDIHHDSSSNGTELMAFPMTVGEHGQPEYEWEDAIELEPHQLYGREMYTQDTHVDDHEDDDSVPVLVFYSSEKGDFGGWSIDLEDDETFDPNKVAVSIIETDHGEMVERLFYDKKEYDCEYDWCDSRGKGYYAGVAWFNKRWEDPCLNEDTDKEAWDDAWEWYDSELAEKEAAE